MTPTTSSSPHIIVVAGMSGAGKTVTLHALEDCGYHTLDHLPADTLPPVLASLRKKQTPLIAIGLDVWDPTFLSRTSSSWAHLFKGFNPPQVLLLEASDTELIKRYGETRRRHPLTRDSLSLIEAIQFERSLLEKYGHLGHRIDTTGMSANTLKAHVKSFLNLTTSAMDICIESFGFKHGAPSCCDLMFDARCLPNPYYDKSLRHLTGIDQPVQAFFLQQERPLLMAQQIAQFIQCWKPDYERDHRNYLTVGIGCTGGQHRSVFLVETVVRLLKEAGVSCRPRHRDQARWHTTPLPSQTAHPSLPPTSALPDSPAVTTSSSPSI